MAPKRQVQLYREDVRESDLEREGEVISKQLLNPEQELEPPCPEMLNCCSGCRACSVEGGSAGAERKTQLAWVGWSPMGGVP